MMVETPPVSDIGRMNSLLERLRSGHRIVPGDTIGPALAEVFNMLVDRIEQLERTAVTHMERIEKLERGERELISTLIDESVG